MAMNSSYKIEITPLEEIRPTENYSVEHAENLCDEISMTMTWSHPIFVDAHLNALMDGHHRFHAAKMLNLKAVPAIRLSYNDPAVHLASWRPDMTFTPEIIWDICKSGNLLPIKSTRHIISAQMPLCRVPIEYLREEARFGETVPPAGPYPTRPQMLSAVYHELGVRMNIRTISASDLDLVTPEVLVPHTHLRRTLEMDPSMASLLHGAPFRIALGQQNDYPFRLRTSDLLRLPPSLLASPLALSAAARWGMEGAFALKAGAVDHEMLVGLLRHGAALIQSLPSVDRSLLLNGLPDDTASELVGSHLTKPSNALLSWIADLLGLKFNGYPADQAEVRPLELEMPVEEILVSNGDGRIAVNPASGKNRYGTTPRPRPEAVHFSSSTASSISDYGFLYCDLLRHDLANHIRTTKKDVRKCRAELSDALIHEIRALLGLATADCDGIIAPSGTDTELLAVLASRAARPEDKLVNILISPEETGRGVRLAGAGRYFDETSATGRVLAWGEKVWPEADIDIEEILIRDGDGNLIASDELDAQFLATGRAALESGKRVLAHVLIGSKTGLSGPSEHTVDKLVSMAPDRVDIVVDACQMRSDFDQLGRYVKKGWMLQVSGSKSLTGPPFSGALLLPLAMRERLEGVKSLIKPEICYVEDWSEWWAGRFEPSEDVPQFGSCFRWVPALLEARLLREVPQALRKNALNRFKEEVGLRLRDSELLQTLKKETTDGNEPADAEFVRDSIISFQVFGRNWDGKLSALNESSCRRIFELLNRDARNLLPELSPALQSVLGQEFHIGQPVELGRGKNARTVLRLVVGMRFFNIIAHAGVGSIKAALESEISDLLRAIDKLELLADNWWKIAE